MGDRKKDKIPEVDGRGFVKDLMELKKSYRNTYWKLRQALKATGKEDEDTNHPDYKLLKDAISDVNFAVTWLHTGKRPGSKRGIERRGVYKNTKMMDPLIMQAFSNQYNSRSSSTLTPEKLFKLEEALRRLSDRERECYELAHGQGFPHSYIAKLLKISKGSVTEYVERAQKKVTEDLGNNLFLI